MSVKRTHLSYNDRLSTDIAYLQKRAAGYPYKPAGLWYSLDDEWRQFYKQNFQKYEGKFFTTKPDGFIMPGYRYIYEIEVDMTKICVLKEVENVKEFHRKYSIKNGLKPMGIDWDTVTEEYSGVEIHNCEILHENVIIYTIQWLKDWGVNCGCVWDLKAVKILNRDII
jgi:hypothetical protein